MPKFFVASWFFLLQTFLPIFGQDDNETVHLTGAQIAVNYGANFLSLTDAAQIIDFMEELMENKEVNKNKEDLKKLERMTFWGCAEFEESGNDDAFIKIKKMFGGEEVTKWQKGYSRRLCQNMYKLLAMVDIELMMFYIKLDEEVNNTHLMGFLHWDEKHVGDVDLHNFKLSRMFAFARILTIRFLQLGSNTEIFMGSEFAGKCIDNAHYMDLLRKFNKKTEELLELISNSTKFKTAQHESFWSWLKNKKEKVQRKLNDEVKKKHWFQKDFEMLIGIYQRMELGVKDRPAKLEAIYGREKPWYKRMIEGEGQKEGNQTGMFELFTQTPWFFPRIHKMVDIFAQVQELGENQQPHPPRGLERRKSQIAKQLKEEAEMREHPNLWKITDLEHRQDRRFKTHKLTQYNILKLLKLFETDKFDELKENTGKDAFESFFDYEVPRMVNLATDKNVLKAVREIILEKVDKAVDWMNLEILRASALEIPVELGTELLSYKEQNVFTLGAFYKFSVHLAKEYKKIINKNKKEDNSEEKIHKKIKLFFGIGGHSENAPNSPSFVEHSKSIKKSASFDEIPSLGKSELIKKEEEAKEESQHHGHHFRKFTEKLRLTKRNSGFAETMRSIGVSIKEPKVDQNRPQNCIVLFQYKLEELRNEIRNNKKGELEMLRAAMTKKRVESEEGEGEKESDLLEDMDFGGHFEIAELGKEAN